MVEWKIIQAFNTSKLFYFFHFFSYSSTPKAFSLSFINFFLLNQGRQVEWCFYHDPDRKKISPSFLSATAIDLGIHPWNTRTLFRIGLPVPAFQKMKSWLVYIWILSPQWLKMRRINFIKIWLSVCISQLLLCNSGQWNPYQLSLCNRECHASSLNFNMRISFRDRMFFKPQICYFFRPAI